MATTPWVILGRYLRVGPDPGGVEAEEEADAAAAAAQAENTAAAAAEPDFTLLAPQPPRVTLLTAGCGAQPDPENLDYFPCVIASIPGLYLLVVFTGPPPSGEQPTYHLALVRNFHAGERHTTASAEHLPCRTDRMPAVDLESVAFVSDDTGGYTIVEFRADRDRATLFYLRSGGHGWIVKHMAYPFPAEEDRKWVPRGAVTIGNTAWWYDLSWGILSCDFSLREPGCLLFHCLPDARVLDKEPPRIHNTRCVAASRNKLRYLEVITEGEAAMVSMWTWNRVQNGWRWDPRYEISFEEIWDDDSYKHTGLPRHVPVLAVVCPSNPDLVFFSLEQRVFSVNVPAHKVEGNEAYELVPGVPQQASGRSLVAWELPPEAIPVNRISFSSTFVDSRSVNIFEIWVDGVDSAFDEIGTILREIGNESYTVAYDTEFAVPDGIWISRGEPPIPDGHYQQLCSYVNGGNLVQIGLGFADRHYDIVGGKMFQFNIQFNPLWRDPNHKGVKFMRSSGLKLKEHAEKGIPVEKFMNLLSQSGLLRNKKLTWITYMGYADFGFLIRQLRGQDLPVSRECFLEEFRANFPCSYDCKLYGKCIDDPIPGGLKGIALKLNVIHQGGCHQAGSDALLALRCHRKLMRLKPDFSTHIFGKCHTRFSGGEPSASYIYARIMFHTYDR